MYKVIAFNKVFVYSGWHSALCIKQEFIDYCGLGYMQYFNVSFPFLIGNPIQNFDQGRQGEGDDTIYSGSIQLIMTKFIK